MENWILSVGCSPTHFVECQKEWLKYSMLVRTVKTMSEAVKEISKNYYFLLCICPEVDDYMLYLKLIRELKPIPILVVPTVHDTAEKLKAIALGADAYMEMTETMEECVATGWALIRRYTELNYKKHEHISIITNQDIFICLDYRKVFVRSEEVYLTRMEFDILQLLMSNKKRVFTYEQIFCHVWGDEYFDNANSILWNHIKRLRQKLKISSDIPDYIKNIHDMGYVFDPE